MRKWNTLCLLLLLLTVLTACGQAQETEQETKENPGAAETGTNAEAATDTITVSTVAELITVIAPDAHIILMPGDYNFSALTEEEIQSCGGYVNPDDLRWGELSVYNAPGLTLEAEESGAVRLITENGYADVMTLTLCDGATLKGLISARLPTMTTAESERRSFTAKYGRLKRRRRGNTMSLGNSRRF